jgi:hypothetical protein
MSIQSAVLAGRRAAEKLMSDTCEIVRLVPGEDEDGLDVTIETVVYSGKCKVQTYEPYESNLVIVGNPVTQQRYQLHIPWGAAVLQVGDIARVAGRERPLRVVALFDKTHATALRVACEEVANANS